MATLPEITLVTPIDTPDADGVSVLRCKRIMNGGDLIAAGFKISMEKGLDFGLSAEQATIIASRCWELPKSVIADLPAPKWLEVFKAVLAMFLGADS